MQTRIGFLTGVAVGYVLGARAGRSRYEQIKKQADTLWNDPRVQEKVGTATETVKAKAPEVQARLTQTVQEKAPAVGQKLSEVKGNAASTVAEKAAGAKEKVADKAAAAKSTAADKAADAKAKVSGSDHTGNQIGVEDTSDVEPHEVKFESAQD